MGAGGIVVQNADGKQGRGSEGAAEGVREGTHEKAFGRSADGDSGEPIKVQAYECVYVCVLE